MSKRTVEGNQYMTQRGTDNEITKQKQIKFPKFK